MEKAEEKKIIAEIMSLNNPELGYVLMNYFNDCQSIKDDMVNSLKLLDELNGSTKQQLRKKILDNFNDTPRYAGCFLMELINYLKEENKWQKMI